MDESETSEMPIFHPFTRREMTDARPAGREGAQATVEFAMILPILCMILFAIVEFGMAFWTYQQVSAGASEGARRAAVSRTYSDRDSRVRAAVEASSPNLDAGQLGVATAWSGGGAGDPATVTVTYPENVTILGITFFNQNLTVTRTMRLEQ